MPKTKTHTPKQSKAPGRLKSKRGVSKFRLLVNFVPSILMLFIATFLNATSGHFGASVLAYATNVSSSSLLASTNQQRTNEGATALSLNSALSSAAQAKANDMVSRDYWSHVTPDGEQPWAFISDAGYSYDSAGENLAYGFATSSETVIGWMNSPSHRENLLNVAYKEVGFGFANSQDFINTGPQTIVVAMYGTPHVQTAAAPVKQAPKSPAPVISPAKASPKAKEVNSEVIADIKVAQGPELAPAESETAKANATQSITQPLGAPAQIPRIQIITQGKALWSAAAVIAAVMAIGILWLIYKGAYLRRYLFATEAFVFHHLHIDFTVLTATYLGWTLLNSSGIVR